MSAGIIMLCGFKIKVKNAGREYKNINLSLKFFKKYPILKDIRVY